MTIKMLHLDDDLAQAVEQQARRSGKTVTEVIEGTLQQVFLKRETPRSYKLRWVTVKGEAQPDVDPNDRDSLIEHMENHA